MCVSTVKITVNVWLNFAAQLHSNFRNVWTDRLSSSPKTVSARGHVPKTDELMMAGAKIRQVESFNISEFQAEQTLYRRKTSGCLSKRRPQKSFSRAIYCPRIHNLLRRVACFSRFFCFTGTTTIRASHCQVNESQKFFYPLTRGSTHDIECLWGMF